MMSFNNFRGKELSILNLVFVCLFLNSSCGGSEESVTIKEGLGSDVTIYGATRTGIGAAIATLICEISPEKYHKYPEEECQNSRNVLPYPKSKIMKGIEWESKVHKIEGSSGDNWPITWVNDSLQITSYGDGDGFDDEFPDLTLGFAHIQGDPPNVRGTDIITNIDAPEGAGKTGIKASGLLMVDGVLYLFVRNYRPLHTEDFTNSRLAWSTDQGRTFQWADWYFANTFGCPCFVQFGPDYEDSLDDYVYIASQDNDNAYQYAPGIVLARVHKDSIPSRASYEFFKGMDPAGTPEWTCHITERKPVFYDNAGTQRVSVSYNKALKRFFLVTSHRPESDKRVHTDALGVFESNYPWGPWKTVYYDDDWSKNCRTYHQRFPVKWMSSDGKEMWLLFSGLDCGYYGFCMQKATIITGKT